MREWTVGVSLGVLVVSACGAPDEAVVPAQQSELRQERHRIRKHHNEPEVCAESIVEYAVPSGSSIDGITAGPDGNVWFAESAANRIGRITPTGNITDFPSGISPAGIAAGADGNLWITELAVNQIGRMSVTGDLVEFAIPTPNSLPYGIAAGPDGNVWYVGQLPGQIGRITPGGDITEFPVPTFDGIPVNIASGPDHKLWFTENSGNIIGRIAPDGRITEFPVPTPGSVPFGIAAGPDGNVWFTELEGNAIGRITTHGRITEFPVPTAGSGPRGIAAGPDGNLWFTEHTANKIGRITPHGEVTEFFVPTVNSGPLAIAAGADGHMWFSEERGKIGRVSPSAVCPSAAARLSGTAVAADAPVEARVDVHQKFSSVDTVCFDFTFQNDLLDPGDDLVITPLDFAAPLQGPGFGYSGLALPDQRTLCVPSAGSAGFDDVFADGRENQLEIEMRTGSVEIGSLTVTITGTPR